MTCDHISKCGDKFKERGNDKAANLKWASNTEQRVNQTYTPTTRQNTIKVLAMRTDWPSTTDPVVFESVNDAMRATGCLNVSKVLSGEFAQCNGWKFTRMETGEDIMGENWKEYTKSILVSNMGRAKTKTSLCKHWGPPYTPKRTFLQDYATIGRNTELFHVVIYKLFVGTLEYGETVDHIDMDSSNNRASNLRAATRTMQQFNTKRSKYVRAGL